MQPRFAGLFLFPLRSLMKAARNSLFYIITICVFALLMWFILEDGKHLQQKDSYGREAVAIQTTGNQSNSGSPAEHSTLVLNFSRKPLAVLIFQIIVILVLSRLFGYITQKIKQPSVIGEIVAGIILGPSILGAFFPDLFLFIFPKGSIDNLHFLSQIGLILFMFIVGIELDVNVLKRSAGTAVMVSHASIVFPFALGVGLSYFLYPNFAPKHVSFLAFALFLGTAMSITALPILARIIQERGLTRTKLGTLALACGAIDDITAWGILAAVIAIVQSGSWKEASITFGLSAAYLIVMFTLIKPIFKKVGDTYIARETLSKQVIAIIFVFLLTSALITELIGIHALIGAFLAGIIMPKSEEFKKNVIERIEDVSLVLLIPLFFAITGLRTQIGLLNEPKLWMVFILVLSVAVVGKFAGSTLAARFSGLPWDISLSLGALMNTRGLIELIVLNIGYDLGVLSPEIFSIFVLMALITTFMTGPVLSLIQRIFSKKFIVSPAESVHPLRILLAFGPPKMGSTLLNLCRFLLPQGNSKTSTGLITAIHLTPSAEVHPTQAAVFEKEGFEPIKNTSSQYGIPLTTIYKVSDDVQSEIIRTARQNKCDLLLLGSAKSVFTSDPLGGKIRKTLHESPCNVGILIDHNFTAAENVIVYYPEKRNDLFIATIGNLIQNNEVKSITIVNQGRPGGESEIPLFESEKIRAIEAFALDNPENVVDNHDLIIVHLDDWKDNVIRKMMKFERLPSVLILKSS